MPKTIFEQVENVFNPFLLEKGVSQYAAYCKETSKQLDSFIEENYYVKEIIIMVQAEIDTIALFAERRLVAIHYYWKKLQQLMRSLEIALDDDTTYDELEEAYKQAEKVFGQPDYLFVRREIHG